MRECLVGFLGSVVGHIVVDSVVDVKVKWLEGVKEEVSHVFVHVSVNNTTIKVVDDATSVHHLTNQILQRVPRDHLATPASIISVNKNNFQSWADHTRVCIYIYKFYFTENGSKSSNQVQKTRQKLRQNTTKQLKTAKTTKYAEIEMMLK